MRSNTMGFWPFGRDPADIELVSRVITAAAQNGYRVRGKLTIHFQDPQRQADADAAGDRCATLAIALLRETPDHGSLIGAEGKLGLNGKENQEHKGEPRLPIGHRVRRAYQFSGSKDGH